MMNEIKQLRWMAMFSSFCGLAIILIYSVIVNTNSMFESNLQLWEVSQDFFNFLFPLFATIPFCTLLFLEVKEGYLTFVHNRIKLKKYLKLKYQAGALLCGVSIFLVSFISFIIILYLIDIRFPVSDAEVEMRYFFDGIRLNQPLIYGFFLSLWRGLLGIVYYTLTFNLVFFTSNIFIVSTGGFIYSLIENFIFSILGKPQYSMTSSLIPTRVNPEWTTISSLLIGPLILIFFIAVFMFLQKRRGVFN